MPEWEGEWEWVTIKELADRLQLNQQTVRNWVNAGELEYRQFGRTKMIPRRAAIRLTGGIGNEMPELLTVTQVAEKLKLCEMTIRNWIDAGILPLRVARRAAGQSQALGLSTPSLRVVRRPAPGSGGGPPDVNRRILGLPRSRRSAALSVHKETARPPPSAAS